jgi:hypothetical protein
MKVKMVLRKEIHYWREKEVEVMRVMCLYVFE